MNMSLKAIGWWAGLVLVLYMSINVGPALADSAPGIKPPDCEYDLCYNVLENSSGTYFGDRIPNNPGVIWCVVETSPEMPNERACLHEVGHFLDDSLGWISESEDWKNLVDSLYEDYHEGNYPEQYEPLLHHIGNFPGIGDNHSYEGWGGHSEMYADIYGYWIAGVYEIPHEILPFFGR